MYSRASLTAAVITLIGLQAAGAQRTDQQWLSQCQRNDWGDEREKFCDVRVSTFRPAAGALRVSPGTNGGVSIVGWDRGDVEVHARIQAHAPDRAAATALARSVSIDRTGNTLSADGPETARREGWHVEFLIYVPRRSDLDLETHNGPLSVREVSGVMDLHTVNGPLSLNAIGGDVKARTSNGPLTVHLVGTRWEGAGLDAETSNGPVTLFIPEQYSANLETGTTNGPMQSDFPLTVTLNGRLSRNLTTKLGNGGATVRAITSNGPLALRRPE